VERIPGARRERVHVLIEGLRAPQETGVVERFEICFELMVNLLDNALQMVANNSVSWNCDLDGKELLL